MDMSTCIGRMSPFHISGDFWDIFFPNIYRTFSHAGSSEDRGLHCLQMSYKKVDRLTGVKFLIKGLLQSKRIYFLLDAQDYGSSFRKHSKISTKRHYSTDKVMFRQTDR